MATVTQADVTAGQNSLASLSLTLNTGQTFTVPLLVPCGAPGQEGAQGPAGPTGPQGVAGVSTPLGVPLLYPMTATVPNGYLVCNGAPFDRTKYPDLLRIYPNAKLPIFPQAPSDGLTWYYILRAQ